MERRIFLRHSLIIAGSTLLPKTLWGYDNQGKKEIYLTIDDGPRKNMEKILENLGQDNKVTFFMVGELLIGSKGFYRACRSLELGHKIGNHSYSHPEFSRISTDQAKREIEKTHKLIDKVYQEVGISNPLFFRFPYGDSGFSMETFEGNPVKEREIKSFLEESGYTTYFWDIDSEDWEYYSKKKELLEIMQNIQKIKGGDNILTHDLPITANHILPFFVSSGEYDLKTLG